ncbi:hypothetical protein JCM11251_005064 [Rhodosporidiobolus azoricus]
MAPITLAASQELAAATPLVNEERNPRPPTLYMSCTVSAKDAQVALANEERNPRPPTLYILLPIRRLFLPMERAELRSRLKTTRAGS